MNMSRLSRRKFLALSGAAAAQAASSPLLQASPVPAAPARAGAQSLAGSWRFAMDRDDAGTGKKWFAGALPGGDRISLPGTLQMQGYGDDITATTQFIAALPRDMAWYKLPQYAEYTKPGHVEVPYLSQPVKHYLGVAWYQREITVPAGWRGKRLGLTLERTRWKTTVYLDEKEIGSCTSLVAPHEYDLGLVSPGTHRLTIRIDNRMILPYRWDGHSVSDAEGSTWNGVVGRIELAATSPVWIDDAQVFPSVQEKSARIVVKIGNATGRAGEGRIAVGSTTARVNWQADGGKGEITVKLPGATPWSEFSPALQRLIVVLAGKDADDRREVTFGMREIRADGGRILLNGEVFNLRATHDGGGFPLTGHPATDVATWKHIIGVCKSWGLNGMRFHSWCPPEAAFTAADEMGFYLQPECGMWNSFDAEGKMLAVLNDETERLIRAYGNHPSMILLNATNEPAGHYQEQLPTWDKKWRETDARRLYSDGTGRWGPPPAGPGTPFAADYLVTGGARGPRGWFGADYQPTLDMMLRGMSLRPGGAGAHETPAAIVPTPCIGHEVGQWCAYPDFNVIRKFTGYMIPGNYRIWRDSAQEHGLLEKNRDFAHASGRFQLACYKEEIEANLRTPGYSGFELLDLHDYLGQGGALIGLLDAFWEDKGYAKPEEFTEFNNETVPLARLKDRVFTTADRLKADVEAAHFGARPISNAQSRWKIEDKAGRVVASGTFAARQLPRGKNIPLGAIDAELAKLPAPAAYRLVVELGSAGAGAKVFRNGWNFWLYPAQVEASTPADVLVTSVWPDAEERLAVGGKVLFLPKSADLDATDPKLSTVPIFWNRLMNPNGAWMLGLWNDAKHPALAGFPTETNCDWQWVDLLPNTHALNVDALPRALQPIVQPIDDWNRNLKLAMLYECSVGKGRLMVCSFDLAGTRPGASSLRRSVLDYMASAKFQPQVAIEAADLRRQWAGVTPHKQPQTAQPNEPTSPDLVDPGQIQRRRQ